MKNRCFQVLTIRFTNFLFVSFVFSSTTAVFRVHPRLSSRLDSDVHSPPHFVWEQYFFGVSIFVSHLHQPDSTHLQQILAHFLSCCHFLVHVSCVVLVLLFVLSFGVESFILLLNCFIIDMACSNT